MVQKKLLTIEFVAQILLKRGLISKEQYSEIILKAIFRKQSYRNIRNLFLQEISAIHSLADRSYFIF